MSKKSHKKQLILPKQMREKPRIEPGGNSLLQTVGECAEISPSLEDSVKSLRGMLKADVSLADELLRVRRKDDETDKRRGSQFSCDLDVRLRSTGAVRLRRCKPKGES